jgi:hypothetical protein
MSMGLAFLYLPFFQIAHAYILITGKPFNEYGTPFTTLLCISAVFYLALGLFVLRRFLLRYFSDNITALTLIAITLGTNLMYYSAFEGPLSHVYNFAIISLFLWLTVRWHEHPRWSTAIAFGLVAGLISLVRPSNTLLFLFPILYWFHDRQHIKDKWALIRKNFLQIILMCILIFMVWLPQMAYWKYTTGSWLFFSYVNEHFYFNAPRIHLGFFSYRNGWIMYAPVMIFSLAGFLFLRKNLKLFLIPVSLSFIAVVYLIFSWWCWWYVGFGLRSMIDFYPLLSIPMAAILTKIVGTTKWIRGLVITFWAILILFGFFKTWQYRVGILHFDGMTSKTYWKSFVEFKSPTMEYYNLLKSPDYEAAGKGDR